MSTTRNSKSQVRVEVLNLYGTHPLYTDHNSHKRRNNGDVAAATVHIVKQTRRQNSNVRVSANTRDFSAFLKVVLAIACHHFRMLISTSVPYPTKDIEEKLAATCWSVALQMKGVDMNFDGEIKALVCVAIQFISFQLMIYR